MERPTAVRLESSAKPSGLSMMDAINHAKMAVDQMTSMTIDSVARCEKRDDDGWLVIIDVVESMARMGDNDLLASYEVHLSPDAELTQFNRQRRYHREDKDQG